MFLVLKCSFAWGWWKIQRLIYFMITQNNAKIGSQQFYESGLWLSLYTDDPWNVPFRPKNLSFFPNTSDYWPLPLSNLSYCDFLNSKLSEPRQAISSCLHLPLDISKLVTLLIATFLNLYWQKDLKSNMAATSWDTYDTTDHTCEWAKSPTIPLTPSAEMLLYQTPAPLTEFHQMKKLPDE